MTSWMRADLEVGSRNRELFRRRFPSLAEGQHIRQLDWAYNLPEMRPHGWINLDNGNMVLVEAVGKDQSYDGSISARYWIAAVDTVIDLRPGESQRYSEVFGEPGARRYSELMPEISAAVRAQLGLPE